jgi:hypothetical protein
MASFERVRSAALFFVAALGLSAMGTTACSGTSGGDQTAGPGLGGGGKGGSGAGGSGANGAGGSAANAGSGGLAIGGGGGAAGGTGKSGCDKIDFLFVVDNSVSMQNEQAQLVASFPGFITAIENTVNAGNNYHVLVTDTDEWGRCNTANPWTGMDPSSTTCNGYIKQTVFEECDRTRGAGVINPAGQAASNKVCPFPAGRRYLQQGDTDVAGTFACAAQVGLAGHPSERPMDSMVAALSSTLNGPGGCNDGFLRDDALLVITFISDDPNYEDTGTPDDWYNAVVAAKHGDPDAVVVVGISPDAASWDGTTNKPKGGHWVEFVTKFTHSIHASVALGDYDSVFTQAVTVVDEGCDAYVPPIQ